MGVNTQHLSLDTPSDSYLPGGLKNYSTQKMITYSDSTQQIVQENVFCLYGTILNLVTKVAQTLPKSDQFMFIMQTGKCHPYALSMANERSSISTSVPYRGKEKEDGNSVFSLYCGTPSPPELKKTIGGTENNLVGIIYITKSIVIVYLYYDR